MLPGSMILTPLMDYLLGPKIAQRRPALRGKTVERGARL